jgi:hypothetical protein
LYRARAMRRVTPPISGIAGKGRARGDAVLDVIPRL